MTAKDLIKTKKKEFNGSLSRTSDKKFVFCTDKKSIDQNNIMEVLELNLINESLYNTIHLLTYKEKLIIFGALIQIELERELDRE